MDVQTTTDRMSNRPVVTIKLASTSDELLQCYALRAAVFMGEQQCPYWEEFDGNDYSASHLMLYVDGEPAASMRVRWFSGFAKLERAIILKRYRSFGLFVPFVEWARDFAAKKGYPKAYLHGQKRLWETASTILPRARSLSARWARGVGIPGVVPLVWSFGSTSIVRLGHEPRVSASRSSRVKMSARSTSGIRMFQPG